MKQSIFSRIFTYRQRENVSPKENFLTEIFAFVLENDVEVFKGFCNLIEVDFNKETDNYKIKTQKSYKVDGKSKFPDLQIIIGDNIIVFTESKIESKEGYKQLENYDNILKTHFKERQTHLIYLTKYYDRKDYDFLNKQIRWYQIYDIVKNSKKSITKQLTQYLKNENISMDKNFTNSDISALNNIQKTISKMNIVLNEVKKYAQTEINVIFDKDEAITILKDEGGYDYSGKIGKTSFTIGFWKYKKRPMSLTIELSQKENKKEIIQFNENLKISEKPTQEVWSYEKIKKTVYIFKYKHVDSFSNIRDMIDFLTKAMDELAEIKKEHPEIFE